MRPPVTEKTPPVMYDESLPAARNTKTGATSRGWAGRLIGCYKQNRSDFLHFQITVQLTFAANCATCSLERLDTINGVQTGPGATQLTRIPLSSI